MALIEIKFWSIGDFKVGSKSHDRHCAWGGSSCAEAAEFTVVDRPGTNYGACEHHLLTYVRDRLRNGD